MKYLDEYRDPVLAGKLLAEIHRITTRPWTLMEVCGGETHTIVKQGIDEALPEGVRMIHGPGCPVCVTPLEQVDKALAIAARPDVIFTSYGDMLRVPGSSTDLLAFKARGADVRIVYSPLDALKIAIANPGRQVVFFEHANVILSGLSRSPPLPYGEGAGFADPFDCCTIHRMRLTFITIVCVSLFLSGCVTNKDNVSAIGIPSPTPFQPGTDNASDSLYAGAAPTPLSLPTVTLPTAIPTETPIPTVVPTPTVPPVINPLTGLPQADPSLLNRRPMAIKVANYPRYVRPPSGLTLADQVFEYYIEGELTPFIAVMYGNNSEWVGPVRSGRFGPIIPPSIPFVIYAGMGNVSVAGLFLAGVFPGLLLGLSLMVPAYLYPRGKKIVKTGAFSFKNFLSNLVRSIPALLFPVILLGGILGGVFTPTEAAAVGVAYAVFIGLVYRTLNVRDLGKNLIEMGIFLGAVMPIVSTCMIDLLDTWSRKHHRHRYRPSSFYEPRPQRDSAGD